MDSLKLQNLLSVAMAFLPPGFRFHPTDEEVVVVYLAAAAGGGGGGSQEFIVIPEIDICKFEPEELPNQFKKNSMVRSNDPEGWFLCKQEQGQNARRSTREGYWKITGNPLDVKSREPNQVIGSKKFLTFYRRPRVQGSKDIKSNWVMHEYYLPDHYGRHFVICHVMLKPDDKAVSGPSVSLPHIEPHTQLNLCNGSWSVSSPSISSRSEKIDAMDFFGDDSESEDCNHSEDAIQMTMHSLLSSSFGNDGMNLNQVLAMQPGASFSSGSVPVEPTLLNNRQSCIQHNVINAGDSSLMEFSFTQDSQFDDSEGSDQDFWNDILNDNDEYPRGFEVQILDQFRGSVEVQNSSGQPAIIRESRQTQSMKSIHGVLPIDEAEGFVEVSSSATVASKLGIYHLQASRLQDHYEDSAPLRNRKIKMESISSGTEAFKAKEKEVKKHGSAALQVKKIESAASSSVLKEGKNSGQVTKLNCKTELVPCSSCHGGVCSSTPPICYLVNLLVGFILLMVFLSQVF